jgi:hypothetical protein
MATIKVLAKMPELPKTPPPILTLPRPQVSERALLTLARSLNLKGTEAVGSIHRDASTFGYSEGAFDLILHRASGAFRLKDRNRWQIDHRSNVEISDEDAIKRARTLLKRYKLLPKESKVLRVSRLNVAAAGPERRIEDHRIIDVAVCLQPIVRGVPLDGPGGKVMVYLDHEGLTCIDYLSRRVGSIYQKVTGLRSPEYAIDLASRDWSRRGVSGVEINEVRFCYFELGWNDEQKYLQPVYIVLATLIGPDERIRMGDIFVTPAAMNPAGTLVPPIRKPRPQKPRAAAGGR